MEIHYARFHSKLKMSNGMMNAIKRTGDEQTWLSITGPACEAVTDPRLNKAPRIELDYEPDLVVIVKIIF